MAIWQSSAYKEYVESITSSPSLEGIVGFHLSDETEAEISALLDANRNDELSQTDEVKLDDYLRLEHLMRMVKLHALEKLHQ